MTRLSEPFHIVQVQTKLDSPNEPDEEQHLFSNVPSNSGTELQAIQPPRAKTWSHVTRWHRLSQTGEKRGLVLLGDLVQLQGWDGKLNDIKKSATIFRESSNQYITQKSMDFDEQIHVTSSEKGYLQFG